MPECTATQCFTDIDKHCPCASRAYPPEQTERKVFIITTPEQHQFFREEADKNRDQPITITGTVKRESIAMPQIEIETITPDDYRDGAKMIIILYPEGCRLLKLPPNYKASMAEYRPPA